MNDQSPDMAMNPVQYTNCDQESWVLSRLRTLVRMTLAVNKSRRVAADDPAYTSAIEGMVHGTAAELIHVLGLEPTYVNIRRPPEDAIGSYDGFAPIQDPQPEEPNPDEKAPSKSHNTGAAFTRLNRSNRRV